MLMNLISSRGFYRRNKIKPKSNQHWKYKASGRSTNRGVVQVHACSSGAVVLHEGPDEAQPECSFKQELGFPLVLRQAEEGHVPQVLFGRVQEELGPLLLWNGGHVVATDEAQVR